jgi:microcystin-dependent protein
MTDPFVGEIRLFAGNFAPLGWAFCDGTLLPIADNTVLFTLIGTTYGGDGVSTFALPNLASRIPIHQGAGHVIGESAGAESVILTQNQLPVHRHPAMGTANAATSSAPAGNVWASWADGQYSNLAPAAAMDAAAISSTGSNLPHENRPPVLALSFIIALLGVFPSQG